MEKTDFYPAVHQRYPSQMEPTVPKASTTLPKNFTPATVYNDPYKSPNDSTPFKEVTTQPATQLPSSGQQYNLRYPPQNTAEATSCFAAYKKNYAQCNSVGAIAMIFFSGGMNIAWSWGYNMNLYLTVTKHMTICWFIAAIIGAICSSVLTNFVKKKTIYLFATVLVLFGGVFFLTWPYYADVITAALYLDGFANGLAIVPMLLLAGEEVIPHMRGKVASLIEMMPYTAGIFLQIVIVSLYEYSDYYYVSFGDTQVHGLLSIIFAAISLIVTAFCVIESPIYYLQRYDENHAINSLRRLQHPCTVTQKTNDLFYAAKNYVDANRSDAYFGSMALIKLCIYRGLAAFCLSSYTARGLIVTAHATIDSNWPNIVSSVLLWLGTFIAGFSIDWIGRKPLMLLGGFICGGLAIAVGIIFGNGYSVYVEHIVYLLIILHLFAGFFISATPVYSSEAFPLRFKSYFVAISFIVQMLVLIIIGLCDPSLEGMAVYFITMGALYLIFSLLAILFMPETKNDTLREAQVKFRGIFSRFKRII